MHTHAHTNLNITKANPYKQTVLQASSSESHTHSTTSTSNHYTGITIATPPHTHNREQNPLPWHTNTVQWPHHHTHTPRLMASPQTITMHKAPMRLQVRRLCRPSDKSTKEALRHSSVCYSLAQNTLDPHTAMGTNVRQGQRDRKKHRQRERERDR